MRYLFLALLMMSSVAIASDLGTAFEAFKQQFPDAQYYEKDVEGGEGGSIRLVFPIIEVNDMPATIVDLDKAEQTVEIFKPSPVVIQKPDLNFVQGFTTVTQEDSKQLDIIAQVLLLHPEVSKVRIDVYGRNERLAIKRANKLCSYLSERGISEKRCETRSVVDQKLHVLKFYLLKE